MNPRLIVYSTRSQDAVFDLSDKLTKSEIGGPEFFLDQALRDMSISYEVAPYQTIHVDIRLQEVGETGEIKTYPQIHPIPRDEHSIIIISTIFNEWSLENIQQIKGKIFIDIQGYVRYARSSNKPIPEELQKYLSSAFCLKGTSEEMSYLSKETIEKQKNKLLISTHGASGVEYFHKGKKTFVEIKNVTTPPNTIGAGDTFFGYFAGSYANGKSINDSINYSIKKTTSFLMNKYKQK